MEKILSWISMITKILFGLIVIGYISAPPAIFVSMTFVLKIVLASILLYRFNSYRKQRVTFTELDRKIVSSCALFILLTSFTDYVAYFAEGIRRIVSPYTLPWLEKMF